MSTLPRRARDNGKTAKPMIRFALLWSSQNSSDSEDEGGGGSGTDSSALDDGGESGEKKARRKSGNGHDRDSKGNIYAPK